jgi:calcium-dependent protein kinase
LELCTGGELFDRIADVGHFTEQKAAVAMQDMLHAVHYMHELHICHRDLKPDSFLLSTHGDISSSSLKLANFEIACICEVGDFLEEEIGIPYYVAPEVLQGKYDHAADIWSLGVILYYMLCGYPPFWAEDAAAILAQVSHGAFAFRSCDWGYVSVDAKNLIQELLGMDPRIRCTAEKALNHEWIMHNAPRATSVNIADSVVLNSKDSRMTGTSPKVVLLITPMISGEKQIGVQHTPICEVSLTASEMMEGFQKAGLNGVPQEQFLHSIMNSVLADELGIMKPIEYS